MTGEFPAAPPPVQRVDSRRDPADVWRWIAEVKALLPAKQGSPIRPAAVHYVTPTEPEEHADE